jgi:hypothetical protein
MGFVSWYESGAAIVPRAVGDAVAEKRPDARGPAALAELLDEARRGLEAGEKSSALAARLWPHVVDVVARARGELREREGLAVQRWMEENAKAKQERKEGGKCCPHRKATWASAEVSSRPGGRLDR